MQSKVYESIQTEIQEIAVATLTFFGNPGHPTIQKCVSKTIQYLPLSQPTTHPPAHKQWEKVHLESRAKQMYQKQGWIILV